MRLVIDTNRLAAALIKSSVSREIILSDKFELYSPDYIMTEIEKYRSYFIKKAKINASEYEEILFTLIDHISLIPFDKFKNHYLNALILMSEIDPDDSAFLALGLAMKVDGIWTEDKHFKDQKNLKVYSTKDLLEMMDKL